MKTIYFVRHGQSEANAQRITAGGRLDVPLTDVGRSQAVQAGMVLKKKKIKLIVSSPQARALETAQIIASGIKYKSEKIVTDARFKERDLGDLSGKSHDEVQLWFSMGKTPPNGESSEAMERRVQGGLNWLKTLPDDPILLVSHGGVSRAIRAILRGDSHTTIDSLASVGNAEVLEFQL